MSLARVRYVPVLLTVALAACGTPDPCAIGNCVDVSLDIQPGDASTDLGVPPNADAPAVPDVPTGMGRPTDRIALDIDPGNSTLVIMNGMPAMVTFRGIMVLRDGRRLPTDSAFFSVDSDRAGSITAAGVFTANGVGSGVIQIRAEAPDLRGGTLRATTNLTVRSNRVFMGMGVPADVVSRFNDATRMNDPANAARILYPLNNALMPGNVAPPVIQWERGVENDIYRVTVARPNFSIVSYVLHNGMPFTYSNAIDPAAWRQIAEADPGSPISVVVDRLDTMANRLIPGLGVTFSLAQGSIYGSVYYWDLEAGRMQRINARTAMAENFMPTPPDRNNGQRCVACHTVSRDGRMLAGATTSRMSPDGFRNTFFDLTADLTGMPAPSVASAPNANCSTFNPDATRLITCGASWSSGLTVVDPRTGMTVPSTGLPAMGATMPEWSPDGNTVALIQDVMLNRDGNPVGGNLAVLGVVDRDPLNLAPARVLHRGSDMTPGLPMGMSDAWPTWAPNSQLLAFQHGAAAFSFDGPASLYVISTMAGASPVRLDRANEGANGVASYRPTFSPFSTMEPGMGGRRLFWLAFYTRRDYGNAQAGTRGTNRRQLWVTAIDVNAAPGTDPSFVPYWLPGQNARENNIGAFWSAEACRMNGADCRVNGECCSGRCNAMGTCEPPAPMECRRRGQTCSMDSDCCMSNPMLRCLGNVCETPLG